MTIDEVIEMLNSEDCKFATSICLMRYRERDCWKCILKEYSKTVYNKAIDDFLEKIQWEYLDGCGIEQKEIEFLIAVSSQVAEQLKAGGENDT